MTPPVFALLLHHSAEIAPIGRIRARLAWLAGVASLGVAALISHIFVGDVRLVTGFLAGMVLTTYLAHRTRRSDLLWHAGRIATSLDEAEAAFTEIKAGCLEAFLDTRGWRTGVAIEWLIRQIDGELSERARLDAPARRFPPLFLVLFAVTLSTIAASASGEGELGSFLVHLMPILLGIGSVLVALGIAGEVLDRRGLALRELNCLLVFVRFRLEVCAESRPGAPDIQTPWVPAAGEGAPGDRRQEAAPSRSSSEFGASI